MLFSQEKKVSVQEIRSQKNKVVRQIRAKISGFVKKK